MRALKILFRILIALVIGSAVAAAILYHLSTRQPEGYRPNEMTSEQRAQYASRLEHDKWTPLTAYAADAQGHAARVRSSGQAATRPLEPLTVSFTQDELNAALYKWTDPYRPRYEPYVRNPYVRLDAGRIVVMGTLPDFNKVLSLYFEPRIDDEGMLRCDLVSVRVGSLPLPEKLLAGQRAKLEGLIRARLPQWQASARLDSTGKSNADAASAGMSLLLLRILAHEPSPPVLFLPTVGVRDPLPVHLTDVSVTPGELAITVRPLEPSELKTTIDTIRRPLPANPQL